MLLSSVVWTLILFNIQQWYCWKKIKELIKICVIHLTRNCLSASSTFMKSFSPHWLFRIELSTYISIFRYVHKERKEKDIAASIVRRRLIRSSQRSHRHTRLCRCNLINSRNIAEYRLLISLIILRYFGTEDSYLMED